MSEIRNRDILMVSVLLGPESLTGKHKKIQQSINENTDTQEQ